MEGRRKREEKKNEEGRREEEENLGMETYVWNISFCMDYLYGTTITLSLSKLCRKNPIRNVVGWYKMSFMVYFEF